MTIELDLISGTLPILLLLGGVALVLVVKWVLDLWP